MAAMNDSQQVQTAASATVDALEGFLPRAELQRVRDAQKTTYVQAKILSLQRPFKKQCAEGWCVFSRRRLASLHSARELLAQHRRALDVEAAKLRSNVTQQAAELQGLREDMDGLYTTLM